MQNFTINKKKVVNDIKKNPRECYEKRLALLPSHLPGDSKNIEKTIIDLCRKYGLKAQTTSDTGVWIDDRKICAIGIHASRYVTTHGLALNCDTDLKWFDHIVPCGIEGKSVTSLTKELSRPVTIKEVIPQYLESFSNTLECDFVEFGSHETENILNSL